MADEEILKEIRRIREIKRSDELYDAIKAAQEIQVKLKLIVKLTPDMPGINVPLAQMMDALNRLIETLRTLEKGTKEEEG